MAFLNKIQNIFKNTTGKHINFGSSLVSSPSLFQAIRCISSSTLFIGGLSSSTDEQRLKDVFSRCGEVLDARVTVDRETGGSKGVGFITYKTAEEASSAIQVLNGKVVGGRAIRVSYAIHATSSKTSGGSLAGGGGGEYGPIDYGASGGSLGGGGSRDGSLGGGGSRGGSFGGGGSRGGSFGGGGSRGGGGRRLLEPEDTYTPSHHRPGKEFSIRHSVLDLVANGIMQNPRTRSWFEKFKK